MQSKTDDFLAELEAIDVEESHPRSFELYEEYSRRTIADTIRRRRESFEKAGFTIKRQLLSEAEREVENFRAWLEQTKNLHPMIAHYVAVSLKSLLLGLPAGVQVAQLFSTILDKQVGK
jgi:GH15 family glucan-1,4-alpha-glucosidase